MRRRHAVAAGIAVVLVPVALFLLSSERRVIGTNTIAPLYAAVNVFPDEQACEQLKRVPAGAERVRLRAELTETVVEGSDPDSSIEGIRVALGDSSGRISSGEALGFREGEVEIPLDQPTPSRGRSGRSRICARNLDQRLLTLFGEEKKPFKGAPPAKRDHRFAVSFLQGEPTRQLARAETVERRYEFGHAGFIGGWGLWLAGLLALAAGGLALWLAARQVPDK